MKPKDNVERVVLVFLVLLLVFTIFFSFMCSFILRDIKNAPIVAEENIKKISSDVNKHQDQILKLYSAVYENGDINLEKEENNLCFSFDNDFIYAFSNKKVIVFIKTDNARKVYFEKDENNENNYFKLTDDSEMYNVYNYIITFIACIVEILISMIIFVLLIRVYIREKIWKLLIIKQKEN